MIRTFFETIAVTFSIFSSIPMPMIKWDERNMRYMFLAFPLIGAVIGAGCFLWDKLCIWAAFPGILRGAGFLLIPLLLTGGIHLDGYVDVCDALASHGDHKKKQEILHDPHIGAFAAIRTGAYFVLMLAVCTALPQMEKKGYVTFGLIFVLSRVLSGLVAVISRDYTETEDLLHLFAGYANKKVCAVILIIADLAIVFALCMMDGPGYFVAVAAQLVAIYYHYMSKRQFGGISGDQAGWFLVQAEKWMMIAIVVYHYILMRLL